MNPLNHRPTRRETLKLGLAASSLWAMSQAGLHAQTLPETARIVVGFPPGGAPDLVARRLADQLTGKLAKAVIVDNRPGASGRIAVDIARQSPADGLTLLLNPAGVLTINPHSYKKLNYDPFKDFAPISLAAMIDFGFAVGSAVPPEVKNLAEFATWAKANNGKVTFGSPSAGAPPHFVGDALSRSLGLNMTHVPYRGGTPALNDLMGGQISALVLTLGDLIQQAKAGRLRLLASSGPARSKFAPDLPTFAEQKVPGLELRDWFGVYIAGAPSTEVVSKVSAVVRSALMSPEYSRSLAVGGIESSLSTPDELDKLGRNDLERWGPIVKASGFSADS
ncbi:MAG: Bug family tripartite tricarboxylate transporter substrate binding protein [Pseudomonadota bacterium]